MLLSLLTHFCPGEPRHRTVYLYIFDLNVIPCDDCDARNESSGSEVQLSFAGLQHFSGQHLEDLMSHLPRSVQALHLDASWRS